MPPLASAADGERNNATLIFGHC